MSLNARLESDAEGEEGMLLIGNTIFVANLGDTRAVISRYRGTTLTRNCTVIGPYSRTVLRALRRYQRGSAVFYERGIPVQFVPD